MGNVKEGVEQALASYIKPPIILQDPNDSGLLYTYLHQPEFVDYVQYPQILGKKIGPINLYGNPQIEYELPHQNALDLERSKAARHHIVPQSTHTISQSIGGYSPTIILHSLSELRADYPDKWRDYGTAWRMLGQYEDQLLLQQCHPFTGKDVRFPYGVVPISDEDLYFTGFVYFTLNGQVVNLETYNIQTHAIENVIPVHAISDFLQLSLPRPEPQFVFFQNGGENGISHLIPPQLRKV